MSAHRVARAGLQVFTGTGLQMGVQIVSLVTLARLLDPAEFGVYAVAMSIVGATVVFRDLGLSAAAVQSRTLTAQTRTNLWWINTGAGAVLAAVVAIAAWPAAAFFREPDVTTVMLIMAPTILMAGASAQYGASLQRAMRFGVVTATNVGAAVLGLVLSITLAVHDAGVVALALPQLITGVLSLLVIVIAAGWLPGLPRRGHGTRTLLRFGFAMFATGILTYVHRNLDVALLGRLHGATVTGTFNRAAQLTRTPISMLAGPFGNVSLATMAPHQDDPTALGNLATKGQVLLAVPILTAAGGLIAAADPLVRLVLGPGWDGAALFVRLIAASEALALMASVGGWIITARGLAGKLIRLSLISTAVKVACLLIGTFWGPYGIVAGALTAQVILWPLSLTLAGRFSGVPTGRFVVNSYRLVAVAAAATLAGWSSTLVLPDSTLDIVTILVAGGGMLIVLALATAVLPSFRRDVETFVSTVRAGVR